MAGTVPAIFLAGHFLAGHFHVRGIDGQFERSDFSRSPLTLCAAAASWRKRGQRPHTPREESKSFQVASCLGESSHFGKRRAAAARCQGWRR